MLAAGHDLLDVVPGQVGRGVPGNPEVGSGQRAPGERIPQPPRGLEDGVTLGHATMLSDRVRPLRVGWMGPTPEELRSMRTSAPA